MNRFVHVGFYFVSHVKTRELEPVFTAIGEDWIRYSPLCWILWTSKPTPHIFTLLASHLSLGDNVLIGAIAEDMFGYLTPWIWDWIQSKRPDILRGQDAWNKLNLPASQLQTKPIF